MPGARAERTEDLSNAERGKIVLFNQFCVYLFVGHVVHRRMILMMVSYIILVFTAQSFRSHAVDPGTGLTLPVARPISQRSINNDKKGDCCCCNIQ